MARLTRIQKLKIANAKARCLELSRTEGTTDSWLAKRRFQAARITRLSIAAVVTAEAALEHTMTDDPCRRDFVLGQLIERVTGVPVARQHVNSYDDILEATEPTNGGSIR